MGESGGALGSRGVGSIDHVLMAITPMESSQPWNSPHSRALCHARSLPLAVRRVLSSSSTRPLHSGRSCPSQLKLRGPDPALSVRCALRRPANQRAPRTNAATKRLSWGRLSVPQAMTPQQPACTMHVVYHRKEGSRGLLHIAPAPFADCWPICMNALHEALLT